MTKNPFNCSLKEWARIIFKSEEWLSQSERKRNCLYNICNVGRGGYLCSIPDEVCPDCKAFDYMPMGLESLISGGFQGIQAKQQEGKENDKRQSAD